MRTIILLLLTLAPGLLMAQSEVCDSSFTVTTVSVSSFSATLVDSSTLVMPERKWVEVQNISSNTVFCAGEAIHATTTDGRLLAASGGAWALNADSGSYSITFSTYSPYISARTFTQNIRFYCITTATNVTGKVTLSQCK